MQLKNWTKTQIGKMPKMATKPVGIQTVSSFSTPLTIWKLSKKSPDFEYFRISNVKYSDPHFK